MSTAKSSEIAPVPREYSEPKSALQWLHPPTALVFAALLLVVIFFGLIRYRLRDMPLERDEGEYAYSGQVLLEGIPPYKLAYNLKLPGIYAAYAGVMKVFGETPAGIHCGLLVVNAVTVPLLYLLVAPLFGRLAAMLAACSWALLSTGTSVMGFQAHATNFVVPPVIVGILLLVRALRRDCWWLFWLSGLFSGIAVLMKQHGIFFVAFCLVYLFFEARQQQADWRFIGWRMATYFAGAVLPYVITCLLLWRDGVFRQFWFWTVSYAGEYSRVGLRRGVHAFLESSGAIVAQAALVWILAAFGLTALWWGRTARRHRTLIALLLFFSFLSLCPGAFFRPHYFILILPVAAILIGVGIGSAVERVAAHSRGARGVPLAAFALCFGAAIFHQRQIYFQLTPLQVFERTYPGSPFVAATKVAAFVENNSTSADRIAVIGSEPEIYFYAHRHSATGYLYMYSLIVRHKYTARMRDEFLREIETNRPKFLVYVDAWDSWGEREGTGQAQPFLDELRKLMNGYERAGVIDIGSPDPRGRLPAISTLRRPEQKLQ